MDLLLETKNVMMETLKMVMDVKMIPQSQLGQIGIVMMKNLQNAGIVVMESSKN